MNKEETTQVLRILRLNYPHSFKNYTDDETFALLNLWYDAFKDDDYVVVANAVKSIIYSDTREFAPNIGTVKEQMRVLTQPKMMSEQEAWNKIHKAIRNGIYGNVKEFNNLEPVLQRIVGTPQQLYDWAVMDSRELQTVVASNIQRSYRTISQQQERIEALPLSVKRVFNLTTDGEMKRLEVNGVQRDK